VGPERARKKGAAFWRCGIDIVRENCLINGTSVRQDMGAGGLMLSGAILQAGSAYHVTGAPWQRDGRGGAEDFYRWNRKEGSGVWLRDFEIESGGRARSFSPLGSQLLN